MSTSVGEGQVPDVLYIRSSVCGFLQFNSCKNGINEWMCTSVCMYVYLVSGMYVSLSVYSVRVTVSLSMYSVRVTVSLCVCTVYV